MNKMLIILLASMTLFLVGCGDSNVAHTVSGEVDANLNINDNACEVAQFNGIYYVFNKSTILGENIGIALDSSTLYDTIPYTLDIVDTYRDTVPYTQEEIDFINLNL